MESTTRKITWTLKNVSEQSLKDSCYPFIVSPEFSINIGDRITDKICLLLHIEDGFLLFARERSRTFNDPNLKFTCKHYCGPHLMEERIFSKRKFSIPSITLDVFNECIDQDKTLELSIEMTVTRTDPNPIGVSSLRFIRENFANFVEDESLSDASFTCSDDVKVSVHRIVLANKSTVFKTIFDTMKEKRKRNQRLHDVDSVTFKEVLNYIYTGNANLKEINAIIKIYLAAVKFYLFELKSQCIDALANQIDSEKVLKLFKHAVDLDLKELEGKVMNYILKYFHVLKTTPEWSELEAELKEKVLLAFSGYFNTIMLETTL